jgi:capsular exopolysaccharide synthesis family protein
MTPDSPAPATPAASPSRAINPAIDAMMEPQRGFNLRQFWHAFLERIWIVALCVLAGFFVALGYLSRTPKSYQAHAVLEVDFQEPTIVAGEENSARMRSMFLASQDALRTIEQNLTNRSLLARVIRAENLAEDGGRELLGRNPNNKKAASPTPSSSDSKSEPNLVGGMKFTPMEEGLAGALSGMVRPVIRRGTRLIDLYITNRDPVMAQRLAEAVGREYIRNSIEHRAAFSQESLRYLLEEEERLKANLQKSEVAVAEYKEKTPDALQLGGGAAATGSQAGAGAGAGGGRGGLVEDKLQELSTKLTAAKSERLRLESELNQVEEAGNNLDELLAVPSVAAAPMVNERRRDVAQMEGTIAALAQRYKDKHPKMIAARAAMKEAQQSLRQTVLTQPALLRNAIEQATHAEESLQAAANAQEKAALALNKAAIGYQELARQAETDRALYESVLRQIKETNLTKDVKTNAVSIAEHASLPHGPVSPIPSKAITLGLLAGLVAGLAFVFGADALDRSIKTVDQAEAILGLPVLAAVPETRSAELKKGNKGETSRDGAITYRLVEEAPEGPVAEAFRNLRASLSLLGPEPDRKTFLFTSALPSEGKSFTSVNYALALAQQGHRVLLIDGDLRRPSIHKVFQQSGNGEGRLRSDEMMGIVDYLVGTAELRDAARTVLTADAETFVDRTNRGAVPRRGELSILAGGRRAPNPAELLSGNSFKELLAEAAEHYDRVVIDSAPILAVSDTLLMVPYVQTSCMVVRANRTPRNAVSRAFSLLAATGTRPAGIILNRLPRRRGAGYYYYYASHGYGAGEGSYAGRYSERATTLSTPETRAQTGSDNGAS